MNCRECELTLAAEQSGGAIEKHLASCAECRALAADLRANAEAFQSLSMDPMPRLIFAPRRRAISWVWSLAAVAAMAVAMIGVSRAYREEKLTLPVQVAVTPMKFEIPPMPRVVKRVHATGPLLVKMLTPDPNVVIYWQVDADEEGTDK